MRAGYACVAAGAGVEVDVGRVGRGGERAHDVVADAAGFEAAAGLEVVEFEEDSASAV